VPLWLLFIILVLATHRVTRLITRDSFPLIAAPRETFARRWARFSDAKTREEKKRTESGKKTNAFMASLAYLWECDWCASMYVGPALTYVAWLWTPLGDQHWFTAVLVSLATSTLTGLIAQREPE
jgi:Protein of unknown function (DUF1360)